MPTSLTIQQVIAATGMSVCTLRYYEHIDLLDPIQRQDNTHRLLRAEDLAWIGFLKLHMLRRQSNTPERVSVRKILLQ